MTCEGTHHTGCGCGGHQTQQSDCQGHENHEGCCTHEGATREHMQRRLDYLDQEANTMRERIAKLDE